MNTQGFGTHNKMLLKDYKTTEIIHENKRINVQQNEFNRKNAIKIV